MEILPISVGSARCPHRIRAMQIVCRFEAGGCGLAQTLHAAPRREIYLHLMKAGTV
jgi:hypothetical protein